MLLYFISLHLRETNRIDLVRVHPMTVFKQKQMKITPLEGSTPWLLKGSIHTSDKELWETQMIDDFVLFQTNGEWAKLLF